MKTILLIVLLLILLALAVPALAQEAVPPEYRVFLPAVRVPGLTPICPYEPDTICAWMDW
jgi:hypothetical protein